jgi:hypothetical protein
MAPKTKVRPTYQTKKGSVEVQMHAVMRTFEMMERHGKYDDFKSAVEKSNFPISVPPKTLNFVKKFVRDNEMHKDELGAKIINARQATPDPYDCDFG